MSSSTEASVLDALEQAELAARERRLSASSEAEDIVSAAQGRAQAISGQTGRHVDDALDKLRHTAEAEADAAIVGLERVAASRAASSARPSGADARVERAVAVVVAHVLGEVSSEPADVERP